MEKRWNILTPDPLAVRTVAASLNCHPAVAAAMVNRNLVDPESASRFLNPSLAQLPDPYCLKDMDLAAKRVFAAILNREKILVFGDYDADGVTATALILEFLEEMGARPSWYIPHRTLEGYGFHGHHTAGFKGVSLIITVDTGIGSAQAVKEAKEAGIDVVVTDHHLPEGPLPAACAVVNPKRRDCASGLNHLAGVGVAFFLCIAIRMEARRCGYFNNHSEPNLKSYCDLVAIGTVSDMVPLVRENRILTAAGLKILREGRRPGLIALMQTASVSPQEVSERSIAFALAPRINAAGRMAHAELSLRLIRADDTVTAANLAQALERLNRERQEMERHIHDQALVMAEKAMDGCDPPALVLGAPRWHPGVVGIVAARLVRRFYRPVVLLNLENGVGTGSARGIEGIDLCHCLSSCQDHLSSFGGHVMAAGLSLAQERLDGFARDFGRAVAENAAPDAFTETVSIDAALPLADIGPTVADQLASMAPFGSGNPEPLFMAENLAAVTSQTVSEKHVRMTLNENGAASESRKAIWFNATRTVAQGSTIGRACFRVQWNRFRDFRDIQLVVEDLADS
ncbi:MAG: single-stranded-DNA-specific exonuclease RecJ [Deltaproteobacteria bacterium]|nr:single-stranded-DNA-specific exonuclease RecJ [Deltaproteobacteria bacterium]